MSLPLFREVVSGDGTFVKNLTAEIGGTEEGGMHAATSHLRGSYTTSAFFSDLYDPSSPHLSIFLIGVSIDFGFPPFPHLMQTSCVL